MTRGVRIAAVLLLAVLAWASHAVRRAAIGRFFADGPTAAASAWPVDLRPAGRAAQRVRVVLLDGLSRAHAAALPELSRRCATGTDFVVDVGFPTVSMPVQHALWTGLTQQQSGVQYRIARIDPAPSASLARSVAASVAVAESHRDIVHSFGFARTEPALDRDEIEPVGSAWRTTEFVAQAEAAVASDAALAFVHVLRIDEAGHAHGGDSPQYAQAAAEADAMLGRWIAADPSPGRTRWFVLADHGHRPAGGHGDAEPEIRVVRACIFGDVEATAPHDTPVHLVDLHRALAEALGLVPAPGAMGRTLDAAWAAPELDATLPGPGVVEWGLAGLIVLAGIAVSAGLVRAHALAGVAWPVVAWSGVVLVHGSITLSNPVVYPPLGAAVLLASSVGFAGLGLALHRSAARGGFPRAIVGLMAPVVATWFAVAGLAGVPRALLGGPPPLVPFVSGYASVLATIVAGGFAVAMLVGLTVPGRRATTR
jgi:Type I phosphodiesterase / nucleotide pyrophosphatase